MFKRIYHKHEKEFESMYWVLNKGLSKKKLSLEKNLKWKKNNKKIKDRKLFPLTDINIKAVRPFDSENNKIL